MSGSAVLEPASFARTAGAFVHDAASQRLRAMVEQLHPVVWRALRRLGVADSEVADVTQEVFVAASKRVSDIEVGRERAFLLAVAVRHAAHAHRSRLRRREVQSDDLPDTPNPSADPEELVDRARAREMLHRLLGRLTFELRTVFVLYEIEQLTMAEIAESLDLPPGTVASRLRRARETFLELVRESTPRQNAGGKEP